MKKISRIIVFALIISVVASSQAQLYIGAGAGTYALESNFANGQRSAASGYAIKAGYVYNISKNFGIGTGLEYAQYNQTAGAANNVSSNTFLIDDTGSAFEYRLKTVGYTEEQVLNALQIPLFLQLKTLINKGTHAYARAGAKYVLPQKFKVSATASQVEAAGYYPDFNLLIVDLPTRGFGSQSNYDATGTYQTENVFLASIEFGFSFSIAKKSTIYAGIYVDKGLSSIIKNDTNNSFIGYNPNSVVNRPLNGLFTSSTETEVKPSNFGFSVAFSFE